jgi:two-component system, response regulator PdtaR
VETVRILLAMSNETSSSKLKDILIESGYTIIDLAKDGNECLRKARALRPDLVIADYSLPLMNGYDVSKVILEDKVSDVIVLVTEVQKSLVEGLKGEVGFVCLTKPLNRLGLTNTIDLMYKNKKRINHLEEEIEELKSSLDTRKEVEKAKGLLMRHLNLSEPEAFKRIQKQSMDRGIPMKEIAKAIILAYDI